MKIPPFRLLAINFPTIAIAKKWSRNHVKMPETHISHLFNPVNRQNLKILLKSQPSAFSVISYQLLKARGNRQQAKDRIWQFSYLKRRLETKHIKAFSLTNQALDSSLVISDQFSVHWLLITVYCLLITEKSSHHPKPHLPTPHTPHPTPHTPFPQNSLIFPTFAFLFPKIETRVNKFN